MKLDQTKLKNPDAEYRLHMLTHDWGTNHPQRIKMYCDGGVGGVVTNVPWHAVDSHGDYLCNQDDFDFINKVLDDCEQAGLKLWLYDEKGYPSGSADGLTLKDHPEYEARGIVCIKQQGEGTIPVSLPLDEKLEKFLYAYAIDQNGTQLQADWSEQTVKFAGVSGSWTLYAFAQRVVFEGSHAEKCGWYPRHYPNIMDKAAIGEFIHNTYEKYAQEIPNIGERIDAVFTDEPSLMSGYINVSEDYPYANHPWQTELPQVFEQMHGYDLMPHLHRLFEGEEVLDKTVRVHFEQTVAKMVVDGFFKQINEWCAAHNMKFSGHNLLEESIGFHVVMNGDLFACLRNMSWPGVDILTGDPEEFKNAAFHYMMAAKFVGSAARAAGRPQRVMVEICPVQRDGKPDFTIEQEIGTMDLIFFSGINHINSYLSAERLGENLRLYTDYFARIAYMLRNASWDGRIGMYYPIESAQALHTPIHGNCGDFAPAIHEIQNCMKNLTLGLYQHQLDNTLVDHQWMREAVIGKDGTLSCNGVTISVMLMPCVSVLPLDILEKLLAFEQAGGKLIWAQQKPQMGETMQEHDRVQALAEAISISQDALAETIAAVSYELKATSTQQDTLFVSRYTKDGEEIYYILNSSPQANQVTLSGEGTLQIIDNRTGDIVEAKDVYHLEMPPYSSIIVVRS